MPTEATPTGRLLLFPEVYGVGTFGSTEKVVTRTKSRARVHRFVDQSRLIAISKSQRTIASDDVDNAIHAEERHILMPLFVRKNKDDKTSKEFYFLGTIKHNGHLQEFIMPDTDKSAVEIGYHLNTPVENNLYEYITERTI